MQEYRIVDEDASVIVIHKMSGFAVETRKVSERDLVSSLKKYLWEKSGERDPYLGIVHRLDQPVEGLMLVAKEPSAAADLSRQLQDPDGMKKGYRIEVYGRMEKPEGELTDYLLKDQRTNTSRVVTKAEKGKLSRLHYEVLETKEETQILRIRLYTGRHHQIRVQMSHAHCPVLGDRKYGSAEALRYAEEHGIRSLQLKADYLTFVHPVTGERKEYQLENV